MIGPALEYATLRLFGQAAGSHFRISTHNSLTDVGLFLLWSQAMIYQEASEILSPHNLLSEQQFLLKANGQQ